jgi:hypothetical protein
MLVKLMCIGRVLPVQGPVNALRAMLDTSLMQQVTADQAKPPKSDFCDSLFCMTSLLPKNLFSVTLLIFAFCKLEP